MSPSATVRRSNTATASQTLSEQLAPIVAIHESVRKRGHARVDVEATRARIRSGRVGFDSVAVLHAAGDLARVFDRVTTGFERTGAAAATELDAMRKKTFDPNVIIASWAAGDSLPRDPAMRLARTIAGVVGNAVLSRVSTDIVESFSLAPWKRGQCPCCGAAPDLALTTEKRRSLICWRCDAMWRTDRHGCLGCGENEAPTLARVPSPYHGYDLAICHACGRYLKERRGVPSQPLLVERAMTMSLDEAAQERGLRA